MIEEVGGHEAAATEGRDDQRGDAKTQSNRAGYRGTADYGGVRYGGRGDIFAGRAGGRRHRRNVIKEAAIFIVGDQQERLCPQCGVRR